MTDSVRMATPGLSIRERWLDLRDRLLASPKFHRMAAAMPFTRMMARRRAGDLFDLCAGFVYSQVLLASVRTGLFKALADGPQDLPTLARRLDLPEDAALRLLNAAASLKLVTKRRGDTFGLGELGAALRGAPGVMEMVEHHALLYRDLEDPVALLRGEAGPTQIGSYWAYTDMKAAPGLEEEVSAPYSSLMAASQPFVSEEVLDAYRVSRHRHVLDVGGGTGTFLRAVASRAPDTQLTLFDLPSVAAQAQAAFDSHGLGQRATAVGGSFFEDALPRGADLITLVRVLYDHSDDSVRRILRAVREAIPDDGTLLLAEPMSDTPGAEASGDAYFGFYLLAMGNGRPRSPKDFRVLLEEAGFTAPRLLRTNRPLLARAMIARPK